MYKVPREKINISSSNNYITRVFPKNIFELNESGIKLINQNTKQQIVPFISLCDIIEYMIDHRYIRALSFFKCIVYVRYAKQISRSPVHIPVLSE